MTIKDFDTRRLFLKSAAFGLLSSGIPYAATAKNAWGLPLPENNMPPLHDRYPAIPLDIASEVVGVSHFNLDRLKKLVDPRPELANATWDFGFGDWESAIAAGSHVGRIDIVQYLIGKGAAPTLFTHAVMGNFNLVKAVIEAYPGVQKCPGPHGISLLQHAQTGLDADNGNKTQSKRLVAYLQKLGDAGGKQYQPVEESEKAQYLGDYLFEDDANNGFSVKLNMRKMLSLGRKGKSGGTLYRMEGHTFSYNGMPSVTVTFNVEADKIVSVTVQEPGLALTARKQG
jgi:hypothetical protein